PPSGWPRRSRSGQSERRPDPPPCGLVSVLGRAMCWGRVLMKGAAGGGGALARVLLRGGGRAAPPRAAPGPPRSVTAPPPAAPSAPAFGLTEDNADLLWSLDRPPRTGGATFEAARRALTALHPTYLRLLVDWAALQPRRDRPPHLKLPVSGCAR